MKAFWAIITAVFMATIAFFTGLFSGGGNKPVDPAPEPGTAAADVVLIMPAVTTQTEAFTVKVENHSAGTISFGLDSFSIEKQTKNGWKLLQKGDDYAVIDILVLVEPGGSYDFQVNLKLIYGHALKKGGYRFCFDYFDESDGGRGSARAEFQIEN